MKIYIVDPDIVVGVPPKKMQQTLASKFKFSIEYPICHTGSFYFSLISCDICQKGNQVF